jgi:hypothetical protein
MKLHRAQQMMLDDGLPSAFIMTAQERHALWEANPPKNSPSFLDPRLEQDRQLREQQKKLKIDALRQSKGLNSFYGSATNPVHTQEQAMSKYVIKPLDKLGHPVMRGMTSINDTAAQEEIDAKVTSAVKRGGSKIVNVLLINTLSEVVLAWSVAEGVVAPCDAEPFKTVPQAPADGEPVVAEENPAAETEEAGMAKRKTKVKKTPKAKKTTTKKAPGAGGLRAGSKQEMLYNMLTRKSGCTTDEAVKATGWQTCGVATWGKKFGLKVTKEKSAAGITRYYGA